MHEYSSLLLRNKLFTWAIIVTSILLLPKGKRLLLWTMKWSFSNSLSIFAARPLCLSLWVLMSTSLPVTLTSISGSEWSQWLSEFSSSAKRIDLFNRTEELVVLFAVFSSRVCTRSCSCFTYLIASPNTEALSICACNHPDNLVQHLFIVGWT